MRPHKYTASEHKRN